MRHATCDAMEFGQFADFSQGLQNNRGLTPIIAVIAIIAAC
jgi:hypothetical protein